MPDLGKDFILTTDASDMALGWILSQLDANGNEHVVNIFSKKTDKAQMNYSDTVKELLISVKSIDHFRHYLIGS